MPHRGLAPGPFRTAAESWARLVVGLLQVFSSTAKGSVTTDKATKEGAAGTEESV